MLEILFEILGEIIINALGEIGIESLRQSLKRKEETNKFLALLGCFLVGLLFGYLGIVILPRKMFYYQTIEGISLVIVPVVAGLIMHYWGQHRLSKGKSISTMSTFMGGAVFAFGASLIRFIYFKMSAG